MEYITYDEYKEIGGVLDVAAFNRYSLRAFSRITQETQSRILAMSAIPKEVKHLARDLIEYMYNNLNQDRTLSSTSQSQGGASESESYAQIKAADHEAYIDGLFSDYLRSVTDDCGVPIIYRGACRC